MDLDFYLSPQFVRKIFVVKRYQWQNSNRPNLV